MSGRGLLERDHELRVLDAALVRVRDGAGALVLVSGEPGIGKSSLVTTWLAGLSDVRTLVGACDDLVTPRVLGPFRDMVRGAAGPLATGLGTGASREELLAAMQEEFSNPLRPTVVVIEDLQWADEATLDAVRFLGRRIGPEPTLLLGTFRDDLPPDHPMRLALDPLTGAEVDRITLTGLSTAAVAELVGGSRADAQTLHAVTGGNPFFVTEVLAAPDDEVPATVRGAIAARLRQVDDPTRTALEQLAVAPGGLELHLAADVIDGGVAAFADAERRGLVAISDGTVRYTHEITRRAVVASFPAARSTLAHGRILSALEAAPTDPARLLHHAIGAGDAAGITRFAPAAARAASQAGAHRDAAAALEQALRFPELLSSSQLVTALTDHARELLLTNRLEPALEQAERAAGAAEKLGDPALLGAALTTLADARYWGLRAEQATDAATRAVTVLRELPPDRSLAVAASTLAFIGVMTNRFTAALAAAEEAVTICHEAAAHDVLPDALARRGTARVMLGEDAGMDDLRDALDTAVARGQHQQVVTASIGLVSSAFRLGRLDEAERAMDVGLSYAEAHDLETDAAILHAMRAGLDLSRGAWSEATARLSAVVGDGGRTGWGETVAAAFLGRLRARRGEPGATDLLDRAWQLALASGEIQRVGPAGAAWAEWGWLTGQAEAVRDRIERAIETARRVDHTWYLGELLRYHALAFAVTDDASDVPEPWASGIRGDWRSAAEGWDARGRPYEQAIELVASGEPTVMADGLTLLDHLGADATATLVRRRLKDLGVRRVPRGPRKDTRANPAGLTNRQAEILGHLAEGATNAEIADRLVLSVRTVDHHVSAILAKLGVGSRRAAVARARELGIDSAASGSLT